VKFVESFIKLFNHVFRKSLHHSAPHDIDVARQNSPPDEREVETAEDTADRESAPGLTGGVEQEPSKESKARAKRAGGS
jgi:hypothetical protein